MNASALLTRLEMLGVKLVVDGDRLRANAAPGILNDELKREIGANKDGLLGLLAQRTSIRDAIVPVSRDEPLALSLFQERLWVLQMLKPENTAFLLAAVWSPPGAHNVRRVVEAIRNLQSKHEILRSTFSEVDGTLSARVVDAPEVACHDISIFSSAEQKRKVSENVSRSLQGPVDLAMLRPRFDVHILDQDRTEIVFAAHHIAVDAWSIGLLFHELKELLTEAKESHSAVDRLQYVDYAAWQRRVVSSENAGGDLAWWTQQLSGAPETSIFPADIHGHTAGQGVSFDFSWDREFSDELRDFAREQGVTVYMALIAACAALMHAYTGQNDVLLGSPMGVRERSEFEALIGPFVNVLVLRVSLAEDPSFTQLLGRVRDVVLDAHAHRNTPFEAILEQLRPQRSFDHSPLFQVAVVQHNAFSQDDVTVHGGGALHELTWFVRETEGRFASVLEYRNDLYSEGTIGRIASQLTAILRAGMVNANQPISRLPLITAAERAQIIRWGAGEVVSIENTTAAQQFERQVKQSPEKTAVTFEGAPISYAQLNERANQLARWLRSMGAGPGIFVGICLDRSIDLIVALFAVMKSGAAYLPLDPEFPVERLAFMLRDSGAKVLLIPKGRLAELDLPPDILVFDPDFSRDELAKFDGTNLEAGSGPKDPAYVIYTSGSTGQPKGVVTSQRALVNFLGAMRREPGLSEDDVLAAVTTVSFDISGLEIYLPLIVGGRVELISRDTASDGFDLAERIALSGVTVMQATTATWRLLLEVDWRPQAEFRAYCGGEALPRDVADGLLTRVAELWNLYGPTETTIWSTIDKVVSSPAPITIGRPIANTQVYLLDSHGEPVPTGVPGELWIGGEGVAIGYHNRPDLTAERFIKDRFSSQPDARLYRTGDLAKWGRDGCVHHLGRSDQQVKIRGFRIELEEVEAVLATHPGVRQVCVATAGSDADVVLVAYFIQDGSAPTTSELRRYLRTRLPDYMVPSLFVDIDTVPLTPNGKVDRRRLPDPFRSGARAHASNEPLAPGAEQALAEVWREILKTDDIGAGDNFFELGGHSLLSLRVAAAFRQRTGISLDPRALFFQSLREVAMGVGRKVQG